MSYPILAAAVIVLLAFFAHVSIGNREALSTRPSTPRTGDAKGAANVERHWVQSMCAFQLVSVDLFVLSMLLFVLGATDLLPARRDVALIAAAFFALWGAAWLVQLLVLRRRIKDFLLLSQWAFWFVCAGLLLWGAQSL